MPRQPAPRRQILRGPRVPRDQFQNFPGFHRLHPEAKLQDQVSACRVARIPFGVGARRPRSFRDCAAPGLIPARPPPGSLMTVLAQNVPQQLRPHTRRFAADLRGQARKAHRTVLVARSDAHQHDMVAERDAALRTGGAPPALQVSQKRFHPSSQIGHPGYLSLYVSLRVQPFPSG